MRKTISKQARNEVLQNLRQRYQLASKSQKTKILDEFVALTKCHRKHAIRLMTKQQSNRSEETKLGKRVYDEAVREALIVLWETADRICGKRLKAILQSLIESLEAHGHLQLDQVVRQRLLEISPATIDRLLKTDAWASTKS